MPPKHRLRTRRRALVPIAALAVLAAGTTTAALAQAASATSTPTQPASVAAAVTVAPVPVPIRLPSLALLCAATDIAAIDAHLAVVARAGLVGVLTPLVDLTVQAGPGVRLDARVTVGQVRAVLGCAPVTLAPTTTTSAPTTPRTPAPAHHERGDN
jgi:hypothetical protein